MTETSYNFLERYNNYKLRVDERLKEFLEEFCSKPDCNNPGCNENLYDPITYLLNAGGKRIRPILLILCCEMAGGKIDDCLNAGIAIEVLHNFTLVHDDIMDNADTRRGFQTIHTKWSINTAILTGDAMIGLSYKALMRSSSENISKVVIEFTNGVIEVCEGQAMDKEFETNDDISSADYIIMIRKKTSELVKSSAVIGSLLGNGNKETTELLRNYAENIGLAFQIQDDLLDIYSTEKKFGKKLGGDIIEKKKTFLYLTALELADAEHRERLTEIYHSVFIDSIRKEAVIDIYNKFNIVTTAKNEIKSYTNKALSYLDQLPANESRNMLKWFTNMLMNRTY